MKHCSTPLRSGVGAPIPRQATLCSLASRLCRGSLNRECLSLILLFFNCCSFSRLAKPRLAIFVNCPTLSTQNKTSPSGMLRRFVCQLQISFTLMMFL